MELTFCCLVLAVAVEPVVAAVDPVVVPVVAAVDPVACSKMLNLFFIKRILLIINI
jgi:hypothetical protein